jgi:hypothetical protein
MAKSQYYDSPHFFLSSLMFQVRPDVAGSGGRARLSGCATAASRTSLSTTITPSIG